MSHNLFISGPSLPSMDVDIVVGNFTDSIVSFGILPTRAQTHFHGRRLPPSQLRLLVPFTDFASVHVLGRIAQERRRTPWFVGEGRS